MGIAGVVLAIITKPVKGSRPIAGAGFRTLSDLAPPAEPSQLPSIYARPWPKAQRKTTSRSWTAVEDETLSQLKARIMATRDIAEHLPGRSDRAITSRAVKLSIAFLPRPAVRWTKEEDDILREGKGSGQSYTEILPRLPGRSRRALVLRWLYVLSVQPQGTSSGSKGIGRKAWTADELSRLRHMKQVEQRTTPEIAQRLGRSVASVGSAYTWINTKDEKQPPPMVYKPYATDEIAMLKQLKAEGRSRNHIAKMLQRSANPIKNAWWAIAAREQILKPQPASWQPEEERKLWDAVKDNCKSADLYSLFPHRTQAAAKSKLAKLKKARQGSPSDSLPGDGI